MALTRARLKKLLRYDPATGIFRWLVDGNQNQISGRMAGTVNKNRLLITVDGKRYNASHLAVLYMTGKWPKKFMDHKNCVGTDNRWNNIREANVADNTRNMRLKSSNRFGLKGVTWCSFTGRFLAQIRVNYRHMTLGRFDTAEEAHAAYVAAAKKYFGEFARAR